MTAERTGALIYGAAGLLKGVRATTLWSAFHLLQYFGAIPIDQRVVINGRFVSAAGVTAGIDGALRVAALLRGDLEEISAKADRVAQEIQLQIQYAPEPPFSSGTPATAPPEILEVARSTSQAITEAWLVTAKRIWAKLGVVPT